MELKPLASESFGVRSMAFLVRTEDATILIDPSVALGPSRFGLPPHRSEEEAEGALRAKIMKSSKEANIITVSHYHYDHHDPNLKEIFKNKTLLIKHPTENINKSQEARAKILLKAVNGLTSVIEHADGRTFEFGNTELEFSGAVPHGTNTRLGYVIELAVTEGEGTFVHTSDVQGPCLDEQLAFILVKDPEVVAVDGPMTYMMYRYGKKALERSIKNLQRIIRETSVRHLLLDHHLLRDPKWTEKIERVFTTGKELGCKVQTFAEFAGKENNLLEAGRKGLWESSGEK